MSNQAAAMFHPERFAHANLFVADVDVSVDFYRDVCGITEVFREPGVKAGFLSNGATHHDIGLMQCSRCAADRQGRNGPEHHDARSRARPQSYRVPRQHGGRADRRLSQCGSVRHQAGKGAGSRHGAQPLSVRSRSECRRVLCRYRRGLARVLRREKNQLISEQWNPAETPPVPEFATPIASTRVCRTLLSTRWKYAAQRSSSLTWQRRGCSMRRRQGFMLSRATRVSLLWPSWHG